LIADFENEVGINLGLRNSCYHFVEIRKKKMSNLKIAAALASLCLFSSHIKATAQKSFSGGQTGASEEMLKAACPAFAHGKYQLVVTSANQTNVAAADIFEHETGARCACTRNTAEKSFRCGPAAPKRL
jgi:uncharacterized Fe-S center protein